MINEVQQQAQSRNLLKTIKFSIFQQNNNIIVLLRQKKMIVYT